MSITEERPTDPNHPLFSRPLSQTQQIQDMAEHRAGKAVSTTPCPYLPSKISPVRWFDAYGVSVAVWMVAEQYVDEYEADDAALVRIVLKPWIIDPLSNNFVEVSSAGIPLNMVDPLMQVMSEAADWAESLEFESYQEYGSEGRIEDLEWERLQECGIV